MEALKKRGRPPKINEGSLNGEEPLQEVLVKGPSEPVDSEEIGNDEPEVLVKEPSEPVDSEEIGNDEPKEKLFPVYISSAKSSCVSVKEGNKTAKYLELQLNGVKTRVPCDTPTEVPEAIYYLIKPMVQYQQGILHKNPEEA